MDCSIFEQHINNHIKDISPDVALIQLLLLRVRVSTGVSYIVRGYNYIG